MLYSKSAEYGIQAMIYLAEKNSPGPVMIGEIAKAYGIPKHFLAKITQTLVKNDLLKAIRGRHGGVRLGKPANEIYIKQVVEAIDGPASTEDRCVIGLDYCSDKQPCPLHHSWTIIKKQIDEMLESEDLSDLAHRVIAKRKAMSKAGFPPLVGSPKLDDFL